MMFWFARKSSPSECIALRVVLNHFPRFLDAWKYIQEVLLPAGCSFQDSSIALVGEEEYPDRENIAKESFNKDQSSTTSRRSRSDAENGGFSQDDSQRRRVRAKIEQSNDLAPSAKLEKSNDFETASTIHPLSTELSPTELVFSEEDVLGSFQEQFNNLAPTRNSSTSIVSKNGLSIEETDAAETYLRREQLDTDLSIPIVLTKVISHWTFYFAWKCKRASHRRHLGQIVIFALRGDGSIMRICRVKLILLFLLCFALHILFSSA